MVVIASPSTEGRGNPYKRLLFAFPPPILSLSKNILLIFNF